MRNENPLETRGLYSIARSSFRIPHLDCAEVTVFLIEAARLDYGLELTEPVRCAADRVIADIEMLIERHARPPRRLPEPSDRPCRPTRS
jgi:hypothetical protein